MKYLPFLLLLLACDSPFSDDPLPVDAEITGFFVCDLFGRSCQKGRELDVPPRDGTPFVVEGRSKNASHILWGLEWESCREDQGCPSRSVGPFTPAERRHIQPMAYGFPDTFWITFAALSDDSFAADTAMFPAVPDTLPKPNLRAYRDGIIIELLFR